MIAPIVRRSKRFVRNIKLKTRFILGNYSIKEFDREFYLRNNDDVRAEGIDPLRHYILSGRAEGRAKNSREDAVRRKVAQFDPDWYRAHYPDIAADGIDPLTHYLKHGLSEGRAAHAHDEELGVDVNDFDREFYLENNHDIRLKGVDPLRHYIDIGRAEGRAKNSREQTLRRKVAQFDPDWYRAYYPDIAASGADPLAHYLKHGASEGRAAHARDEDLGSETGITARRAQWVQEFDAGWYLRRNPDVVALKVDPLTHFVTQGILENRRPNGTIPLQQTAISTAAIAWRKRPSLASEVSLFVAHSPDGRLKPNVPEYLRQLRANGIAVILIVAADAGFEDLPTELESLVEGIVVRENVGYDFAAWAHVFSEVPELWDCELLYFMNDSVVGPLNAQAFATMIEDIRGSSADMVGLTESIDRGWHLQSYFLAFKEAALRSSAMRSFVGDIVNFTRKDDVVNEYETRLAASLRGAGLVCEALFPTPQASNPTLYAWRELIARGYPFVKLSTIRGDVSTVDIGNWREILDRSGYDSAIGDRCLQEYWQHVASAEDPNRSRGESRAQMLAEFHGFLAARHRLAFPAADAPEVSVILVVGDQPVLAYRTLKALETTWDRGTAEVIVVCDGSHAHVLPLLQRLDHATIRKSPIRLGFHQSVNRGAAVARGRALIMVDAEACPASGALSAAIATLQAADRIAIVGGRTQDREGRVIDAGMIVWRSGEGAAYGSGHRGRDEEVAFRREVDSVSHRFVAIRTECFEKAGRFDPRFDEPDAALADLCLTVRAMGHRIVYDPRLEITVLAAASSAPWTDRDSSLLRRRHRLRLEKNHLAPGSDPVAARASDRDRHRILILTGRPDANDAPTPPARPLQVAEACAAAGFAVSLHLGGAGLSGDEAASRLGGVIEIVTDHSTESALRRHAAHISAILVDDLDRLAVLTRYFQRNADRLRGIKIILDAAVDARARALPAFAIDRLGGDPAGASIVDLTLVQSPAQADQLFESGFRNIHVASHAAILQAAPGHFGGRRDLLVVGTFDRDHGPDLDGLFWLIDEIMPRLDAKIGEDYKLQVVGPTGSQRLAGYRNRRVIVHGGNHDVRADFDSARLLVQPASASAFAVPEAMARGLPVVAAAGGGSGGTDTASGLVITADADAFAAACATLYDDEPRWSAASAAATAAAREAAAAGSGSGTVGPLVAAVLAQLLSVPTPPVIETESASRAIPSPDAATASAPMAAAPGTGDPAPRPPQRALPSSPLEAGAGCSANVALIYLARGADVDSARSFERFITSYRRYDSGIDHQLIVILKGFATPADEDAARQQFARVGARTISLADDGFDIAAYTRVARQVHNQYVCFLNTHAEILCEGWLELLACRFTRREVGLVGATGSFEAHEAFEGSSVFPNVHLRTNALMIPRRLFLSIVGSRSIVTKEDAYGVESGPESLTREIMKRGLEVLLVGRNGRSYPPEWWPSSDTFRQGRQDNLLIADNQTRWFETADGATRQMLFSRAWGNLIDPNDFPLLP